MPKFFSTIGELLAQARDGLATPIANRMQPLPTKQVPFDSLPGYEDALRYARAAVGPQAAGTVKPEKVSLIYGGETDQRLPMKPTSLADANKKQIRLSPRVHTGSLSDPSGFKSSVITHELVHHTLDQLPRETKKPGTYKHELLAQQRLNELGPYNPMWPPIAGYRGTVAPAEEHLSDRATEPQDDANQVERNARHTWPRVFQTPANPANPVNTIKPWWPSELLDNVSDPDGLKQNFNAPKSFNKNRTV